MPTDTQPRRSPRARMSLSGTGSGGLQLGGSSMISKFNTKENDTMSQTKDKLARKKRAASVGGSELQNLLKESQNNATTTSRRGVPGPRKSAIRSVPQVFLSPTGLVSSPKSRPVQSLMALTETAAPVQVAAAKPAIKEPAPAKETNQTIALGEREQTMPFGATADRNCATQVLRPKRRVTFSKRQERTEFAKDEPTLRLGTLRRDEPGTPSTAPNSSNVGTSYANSDSNSDFDSNSDSSSDDSMDMDSSSSMHIPSSSVGNESSDMSMDQDATRSMEMTAAHGQIRKRAAFDSFETSSDAEGEVDNTMDGDQSGAMDMTEAIGSAPMLKRRRSSLAQRTADKTNEITQSKGGYLLPQAGTDDSMSFDEQSRIEDDQSVAMDLTMPMESRRRSSQRLSQISVADASGVDMSMSMDMTKVITTAIRTKEMETESDEDDDADRSMPKAMTGHIQSKDTEGEPSMEMDQDMTVQSAMEMTVAIGKITSQGSPFKRSVSRSPEKPRIASPERAAGSPTKFRQSLRGGIESPSYVRSPARRVGGTLPPPNRPMMATAAPLTTFRQSLVAGVESPNYVHSPARRVHAPTDAPTPSKANTSAVDLSFSVRKRSPSPKAKAARQAVMSQGRKSLGSNLQASSLFRPAPVGSEARFARSSIVAAVLPDRINDSFSSMSPSEAGEMSNASIQRDSFEFGENGSVHMPLVDFLNHVGVQFHEDMTAYRRRPVPPTKDAEADNSTEGQVGLMRLVKASCGSAPQLEALRDACREIKEQVDDGRERLMEMEQAFYDNPPDFVKEIMCLQNEEEKKEMEGQFKLQKQAARALAVSDYYGWRMDKEFDQEMVQTLQAYHGRLQCDLQIVLAKRDTLRKELLPVLREKHAKLSHDLAMTRKRQSEIEQCDPEELKALYGSIEEQHDILELMRSKLHETEEQHQRALARLEENREKISVAENMIAQARAVCDQIQGYTRGEAKRLVREIRNVEKLHLVRLVRVEGGRIEMVLDGWLDVQIALEEGGKVEKVEMTECVDVANSSLVRRMAVKILQDEFESNMPEHAVQVLRRISKTLIRQRHLLAEIEHLRCRFPLELTPSTAEEVSLKASVVLPRQRSKISITAISDLMSKGAQGATLLAESVQVETIYGSVDALAMLAQILDYLAADPTIGSLSRACLETIETFDV